VKTVLIVIGGLVAIVVVVFVWLLYSTCVGGRRAYRKLVSRIAPIGEALAAGREPAVEDLVTAARNRETRQVLYDALAARGRMDLFPGEFLTWEAMAEANLVQWLCHPHELGSPPDEIELMAKIPAPEATQAHYFLFRYRMRQPHWAARRGWLAGVAGPYDLTQQPKPHGDGTFSRFEAFESRTPEEHVAAAHGVVVER
jgi:hypothetical protein